MLDLAIDNRVFIYDIIDAAIQEIDLLFNTTNTELIGYTDYGTNWMQFLWVLNPSITELENYIYNKLNDTYFVRQLDYQVNVAVNEDSEVNASYIVSIDLHTVNGSRHGKRIFNL